MSVSHIIQKADNDRWQQAHRLEPYAAIGHPIKIVHLPIEQASAGNYRKIAEKKFRIGLKDEILEHITRHIQRYC